MEPDAAPATAFDRLQKMGFSSDDIHRASEDCSSIDFDDLLDFLLAEKGDVSNYKEVRAVGNVNFRESAAAGGSISSSSQPIAADEPRIYDKPCGDDDDNERTRHHEDGTIEVEVLRRMGFSSVEIGDALAKFESPTCMKDLVGVLIGEKKDKVGRTAQGTRSTIENDPPAGLHEKNEEEEVWDENEEFVQEKNEPEEEDVRSKLRGMGFSMEEIQNALRKHGRRRSTRLDMDDLLEILVGDDDDENNDDDYRIVHDLSSPSAAGSNISPTRRSCSNNYGRSRRRRRPTGSRNPNWSHHQLRRWYMYLGRRAFYDEQFGRNSSSRSSQQGEDGEDEDEGDERLGIRRFDQDQDLEEELILLEDVKLLTPSVLESLLSRFGSIDLLVGGSPCNNLSGNNRVDRVGLSGKASSLFFEFPRILHIVKRLMAHTTS